MSEKIGETICKHGLSPFSCVACMRVSHDGFDHPCKQTCSGWKQGYEKGIQAEKAKAAKLLAALKLRPCISLYKRDDDIEGKLCNHCDRCEAIRAYEADQHAQMG